MKLFHGSKHIISKPYFGGGKAYNDYGYGFYCTEYKEMAMEWAVSAYDDGYVNCYEFDAEAFEILNLMDEKYCILHWLTVLLENRIFNTPSVLANEAKAYLKEHYSIDYERYDVIRGYRADDSYFSFAQDFLNGTISVRQLNNAMHLGKLGEQVVIKSKEAFDCIKYTGYEIAESKLWFPKKSNRDGSAREAYFNNERNKRIRGDIYITHILDEEVKSDDARLRQIIY